MSASMYDARTFAHDLSSTTGLDLLMLHSIEEWCVPCARAQGRPFQTVVHRTNADGPAIGPEATLTMAGASQVASAARGVAEALERAAHEFDGARS
jgi:hypothetical protein